MKQNSKPLALGEIKLAVYNRFDVNNTSELRASGGFRMATDGMGNLNFRYKDTWKMLYRKFVGYLPDELEQTGYGCINGVNIFQYFKPWRVFGLDPKVATDDDIKSAYRKLSTIYHSDNKETGDREIFERINLMYQSITTKI